LAIISASDSKVTSTSPILRCMKVVVASRPPAANNGAFFSSLPTNSCALASLPPGCLSAQAHADR
jgi:hypothetical protein